MSATISRRGRRDDALTRSLIKLNTHREDSSTVDHLQMVGRA
jgi:hypothetical protein